MGEEERQRLAEEQAILEEQERAVPAADRAGYAQPKALPQDHHGLDAPAGGQRGDAQRSGNAGGKQIYSAQHAKKVPGRQERYADSSGEQGYSKIHGEGPQGYS